MAKQSTGVKLTAAEFTKVLTEQKSPAEAKKNQRFYEESNGDKCLGIRMGTLFSLAKKFSKMPLKEVDKLFSSPYYEIRMGAVSIMDFQAREKKITPEEREALYKLYIKKHKRLNNWDFVDRAAPHVVGGYLSDRSRAPLYKLARSKMCGSVVLRLLLPGISFDKTISTIHSKLLNCLFGINTKRFTKLWAVGFAKQENVID